MAAAIVLDTALFHNDHCDAPPHWPCDRGRQLTILYKRQLGRLSKKEGKVLARDAINRITTKYHIGHVDSRTRVN